MPFSFLSVEVSANDGSPHQVQLYTDVSGEWLAQSDQSFEWQTSTNASTVQHQFSLQNQTQFTEVGGRLRYGSVIYATQQVARFREILIIGVFLKTFQVSGMTYQVADAAIVRPQFQTTGVLNNTVDTEFRVIGDRWPIFAFAHDLGVVGTSGTTPVVYTIGYVRNPLVQLSNIPNVNSVRPPYYLIRHDSASELVCPSRTPLATVLICPFTGRCPSQRLP